MSEIQSAEEFVKFIDDNYINLGAMTKQTITDAIRARDKAIVELCRGAIRQTIDAYFGMGSGVCKDCELAFDDVLRELGGEQ